MTGFDTLVNVGLEKRGLLEEHERNVAKIRALDAFMRHCFQVQDKTANRTARTISRSALAMSLVLARAPAESVFNAAGIRLETQVR